GSGVRPAAVGAAIDRQAVAGDGLAAVAERQPERERALAGGRRPDDRDQRRRSNRQTVHSRTSVSSTTAPRICWRNASFKGAGPRSPLAEGLDDVALVLGPERALHGQQLGVQELVERVDEEGPAVVLVRHAGQVALGG